MGLKNPYTFLFSKFVDKKTEDKRQKDKVCYRYLVSLIRKPTEVGLCDQTPSIVFGLDYLTKMIKV